MKQTKIKREYMPIGETAKMLGVSVDTVRRWEKQGHLVSKRLDGKNRYFALDHVLELKGSTGLTIDEVANELGQSVEDVILLIRAGKLPLAKTAGGESVVKRSALQDYVKNIAKSSQNQSISRPKVASESIPSQSTTSFVPSQPGKLPSGGKNVKKVKEKLSHSSHGVLLALKRGKMYLAKTSLKRIVLAVLAVLGVLVLLLATLFLFAPEQMGKLFAYSGESDNDSGFSKPDTNIFIRGMRPLTDTALGIVEFVNPDARQEVTPNTVPNANELFSIDADGNVTSNYPFSFKDSAYIKVPDNGLVENLNSQYVQGYAPGNDSGSLAILPIRGNNLVEGSVTGDAIAERAIAISHLSPALQSMLNSGTSGARGPAGPQGATGAQGPAGPQGPPGDSGSGSGVTGVNAGAGLQGGGSSGYLNIDINTGNSTQVISDSVEVRLSASGGTSTTGSSSGLEITSNGLQLLGGCSVNQVLAWSGTGWVCSTQSSGGGLTTQASDGSTIVSNTTNIQFGPVVSSSNEFVLTNLGSGQSRLTLGSNVLQSTNYASTLDPVYVNTTETLSGGDITGSYSSGLIVGADAVALGTDTTGNFVATISGSNGLSVGGSGSESAMVNLSLDVSTTGTTSTISSNSGLELTTDGLRLLGGCSPSEILKWNGTNWLCSADNSSALNIEENDGLVLSNASVIDFLGSDFAITSAGGEADVSIDYANSGITKRTAAEIISGNWTFNDSSFTLQDNSDNTKKLLIELSSIGGGTTRTLSAPNANGTIVSTGNLTDITAVGTITSGVWQGSTIGVQYGGTGANTLTTNGVLYGNGTGAVQATTAGTAGQLLAANASGVPSFVGLSGDASLTSAGLLTLANSGVTASTYGSATQVPVFTVDAKGRITSASNTTISGVTPGGSAGGDLSGSYPNPTVARINGNTLGATTADAGNILVANGASWISRAITGDITVGGTGAFTINADSVALGTDTTGSYVASIAGGTGLSVVVSGSENAAVTINLDVATTGTTGTTNSNSGLEIGSDGVRLLGGCGTGQILKWNGTAWACATDDNAGSLTAQENDVTVTGSASTLDFLGADFNLSETPAGEVNISLDYVNSGIARLSQNETVAGSWTFNSAGFTLQDSVTPSKKLAFDVSGVTSATTRTLAVPDVNGTIVTTGNLNSITTVGTVTSGAWQGGVIGQAYGGTGLNTSTAANGSILIGNGAGLSLGTLTQGSGITITNGAGSITIAASLGTSVDLASEVTGNLLATSLQAAAADLGAANVNVDFTNTNAGGYVTNITTDGTITAATFSGNLTGNVTGNADTASALAANPSDCAANQFATTIAANGDLTCAALTDADVPDGLTISASGSVADGALSSNVTLLGATITKDELTNSGSLGFTWSDSEISDAITVGALGSVSDSALSSNVSLLGGSIQDGEVDDNLTISASGSVADGALSANVSLLGSDIDLNVETTGNLLANRLQAAASDLGAADVNINLSNTNGSFVTNLTVDGTITAATFSGNLTGNVTGNADTASALAANPSDCAANQFATTIAANGDLTCAALTDADVPDTLTIGASSTVADGALSGNVTLLGATITKDELTGTGVLGFTWSDSEVADDLTISASGSVADGALSANVSLLGSSIDLASEVTGNLLATSLQAAAADLGAANVNVDFTNTNAGGYVTNITTDGTITAATFSGNLTGNVTGNADTASALAANPSDCAANQFATTIAANGDLTCAALTDADVPDGLTISASGSVADGALSSNVTLLGATITKDELTNSGSLGFTWSDSEISDAITVGALGSVSDSALSSNVSLLGGSIQDGEVDDNLTISASGSVADGALSANVSLLGSDIDLNVETTGNLLANRLQAAASDLGAADVNINLSNTNGSFVTNLTVDGTITAATFSGNLTGNVTGNADTASALAANPSDCAANQFATTIAANGDLTCAALTDADVPDTLTIGASSTVADGALSGNVTLLGATITKDELTGTGVLGFTWSDSEVADDLTISASGSVADGALSANVSLLGSSIDLASEVTGNLLATSLQAAAADLGAANVNVDFTNTNAGGYVTNITTDGTITAATFSGNLTGNVTGNADTASALAANPSDCAANQFATTIAANGDLTCAALTDADVPDGLTISASGSVADGALSSNVTLLGATITKDELTNSGSLGFTWSDSEISDAITVGALGSVSDSALSSNVSLLGGSIQDGEVDDNLTISASGSVADGALSANVSLLGSDIDLNVETTGNLLANRLQAAASDLGAADVNINLSNTNGSFVTNLTVDGTITAATFSGNLTGNVTGNADTASALAANPSDCAANQFATTIAANGDLTCAALTDADVPDTLTIGASSTVADGALSGNVTLLGATITKDELTGTGVLGFSWSDDEVSDTLTASILKGSGSTTDAVDLATAEVAGNLRANNLQSAATDLGAADVTVNLSNSNGSFNTNLIIDGTFNTNTFTSSTLTFGAASDATIAAGNNQNLIVQSQGSGSITLSSGSGVVSLGATTTLRRNAAGTTTIDLLNTAGNTVLAVTNSDGTQTASLNVEGGGTFGANLIVSSGGITVTGNSTITGTLTGLTGLTVASGGASINGALNLNNGGITNAGSIAGATTLGLTGAITGATATNTINGLVINSGALSSVTGITFTSGGLNLNNGGITNAGSIAGATTLGLTGAITGATATNTINGLVINSGALSSVTGITFTSGGLNLNNGGITNAGSIAGATTIAASGNINTSGGAIQTSGTTRIDNSGNLTNIGTITTSGNITTGGTFIGNGNNGINVAQCAANQYIGGGVRVDDGITTNGACTTDLVSDERLKENVKNVSGTLDTLNKLRVVSYNFNSAYEQMTGVSGKDKGLQVGFIAQEAEALLPGLVGSEFGLGDYIGINYHAFSGLLTAAIQELSAKVDNLESSNSVFTDSGLEVSLSAGQVFSVKDSSGENALLIDDIGNASFKYLDADKIFASGIGQSYPAGDNNLSAGDVVYIDQSGLVRQSTSPNQTGLLGVVSSAGGVVIGEESVNTITVAAAGKVHVRVSTENGPITPGDYLTSSSVPGVAMRSDGRGPTFGMAATGFSGAGEGRVEVTVGISGSLGELAGDVDTINDRIATIEQEVATIVENGLSQQDNYIDYTNFTVDNLNVTQDLFVSRVLVIEGDSTFNGDVFFNKVANFRDEVIFGGAVTFNDTIKVSENNAGYAVIHQGASNVMVEFVRPYETAPIVTASLIGGFEDYTVANVTRYGFEIVLKESATRDIDLSWTAIEMLNPPISLNE